MSKQTIFKLKDEVTKEDLVSAGFDVNISGAIREVTDGIEMIYIPLKTLSGFGYRVIQYNHVRTEPEDMNPEDIEDLIARGWVERIEK